MALNASGLCQAACSEHEQRNSGLDAFLEMLDAPAPAPAAWAAPAAEPPPPDEFLWKETAQKFADHNKDLTEKLAVYLKKEVAEGRAAAKAARKAAKEKTAAFKAAAAKKVAATARKTLQKKKQREFQRLIDEQGYMADQNAKRREYRKRANDKKEQENHE